MRQLFSILGEKQWQKKARARARNSSTRGTASSDITRIIRANKRVMSGFRRCRGRREAYNVATTIRIACNRIPPPPPPRTERALKRTQTREIPQNSTTMKRGNTEDKRVSTKSWNSIAKICSSKVERVILPRASLSFLCSFSRSSWNGHKSRDRGSSFSFPRLIKRWRATKARHLSRVIQTRCGTPRADTIETVPPPPPLPPIRQSVARKPN